MNILFYRYGSICEPDLMEAFEEYGLSVYTEESEIYDKLILPAARANTVSSLLAKREYAFVFSINYFPDISAVCNIYKIPYMCLIVDSPIFELFSNTISNPCNRIFMFDSDLYREFSPLNPEGIFHIPLATNVKRWDKILASADNNAFRSGLSFVGSLYTEKCPFDNFVYKDEYYKGMVEGIIEAQLKVYGYYFVDELITDGLLEASKVAYKDFYHFEQGCRDGSREILAQFYIGHKITATERIRTMQMLCRHFDVDIYTGSDTSAIPALHNHGRIKTHTEMPLVFAHSDINLNMTSRPIRSGIPLRVFDVLGCGGFLITNYQNDLADCFNNGEHLCVYSSPEELLDLIAYYREHPAERCEIARNGYECVRDNHNYIVRVGQMITRAFGKE